MSGLWDDAQVIHTYTRGQAITDGVLVDVTDTAREAGFTIPVALTAAAHADTVAWDGANAAYQDESGRLWDVLTMARHGATRQPGASSVRFGVLRVPNTARATTPRIAQLVAHIGPGDQGEPVITIMQPGED